MSEVTGNFSWSTLPGLLINTPTSVSLKGNDLPHEVFLKAPEEYYVQHFDYMLNQAIPHRCWKIGKILLSHHYMTFRQNIKKQKLIYKIKHTLDFVSSLTEDFCLLYLEAYEI